MPQIWADSVEQHKHLTRERVISATLSLVKERGLSDVTMSDIAERAGIGRATLYNYFPDVDHILLAWHDAEVDRYMESLKAGLAELGDARSRLRAVLVSLASGFTGDHDEALDASRISATALSPEVRAQMGAASAKVLSTVTQILTQGVEAHELRADLDVPITADLILRLATVARDARGPTEDSVDATLTLLFGGIRAQPDA